MKLGQLYPSKFLSKDDLGEQGALLLTIKSVTFENVGREDDPEQKPCLHFNETNKPLVLNRTNGEYVGSLYGDDTDTWAGKQVVVYFDATIMFAGKRTGGLRVRAPKSAAQVPDLPF